MTRSLLDDAFAHHTWATLAVTDAVLALTPAQLATSAPGTYGSILDTMRHLVGADSWYLFRLGGIDQPLETEDSMDLTELRSVFEGHVEAWSRVLAAGPDPDDMVKAVRDDGSETHASRGLRFAQALHHGTDHRSQVCTALTSIGIEPPTIDLWDFGMATGRVVELPPTS